MNHIKWSQILMMFGMQYEKEHLDAKRYRIIKKPKYNDLWLICGDPASDECCNQAHQDLGCNGVATLWAIWKWRIIWSCLKERLYTFVYNWTLFVDCRIKWGAKFQIIVEVSTKRKSFS
ncbi:hypothetical protein ACJW31_11G163200 [Castanea mollissima]